jgi:Major Facilitator Superfamily.
VAATLMAMGAIYFVVMAAGALGFRVAPNGWKPAGWTPAAASATSMITKRHVHLNRAWKTPQFWLVWGVLFLNVTAGIAVISMASPMLQDVFGGKLAGLTEAAADLTPAQKAAVVAAAAGLVGLISLFNSLGRCSGPRCRTRSAARTPTTRSSSSASSCTACCRPGATWAAGLFVISVCVILSMYGGGFATVPAYLADLFGTQMVGAIHGRLLTAWSAAGIFGPFLIAAIRQTQLDAGVAKNLVYDRTLYIMAGCCSWA